MAISKRAVAARESARQKSGEFGVQTHAESDLFLGAMPQGSAISAAQSLASEALAGQIRTNSGYNVSGIGDEDDLAQVALEACVMAGIDPTTARGYAYMRRTCENRVADSQKAKDVDTVDRQAYATFKRLVQERQQVDGAPMTSTQKRELEADIRDNWDQYRQEGSKAGRKPRRGFVEHVDSSYHQARTSSIYKTRDGADDDGTLLIDTDQVKSLYKVSVALEQNCAELECANREAGRLFELHREQAEDAAGRKLTEAEEEDLAEYILDNWLEENGPRPERDFYLRRNSFCNLHTPSWTRILEQTRIPSVRRKIAWNVLAETSPDVPAVRLGEVHPERIKAAARTLKEQPREISQLARDWANGHRNEVVEALFAPWGDVNRQEKAQVAQTLASKGTLSQALWDSAAHLCSTRKQY